MAKDRTIKTTLLNMCMVYDEKHDMVLVQDKVKSASNDWSGYTFPGGHVENSESLTAAVIREVKEETGLDIKNIKPCGIIDWYHTDDPERWMVFLYSTRDYSGELLDKTREGKVFWMKLDEFQKAKKAPDMDTYLELFMNDNINEAYAEWNKEMTTKYKLF